MKVVPTGPAAVKFHANDIAVMLHTCLGIGSEGSPTVSSRPNFKTGASIVRQGDDLDSLSPVLVGRSVFESPMQFRQLQMWRKTRGQLHYSIEGFRASASSQQLTAVLSNLLFSGHSILVSREHAAMLAEEDPGSYSALLELHSQQFANCTAGELHKSSWNDWSLTSTAVARLEFGQQLIDPVLVSEAQQLQDGSLQDASAYQLIRHMESQGWSWRPMRAKAAPFKTDDPSAPMVWFTRKTTAPIDYLGCLCQAQRLKAEFGFDLIPHGAPAKTYTEMLQGKAPAESTFRWAAGLLGRGADKPLAG
jgi:hypothetical protein